MNNKDFEPIRIRIMQEAYELADRGDAEGYNSVKVMCNDVQNLLRREWVGLTDEDIFGIFGTYRGDPDYNHDQLLLDARRIEAKLKDKNHVVSGT